MRNGPNLFTPRTTKVETPKRERNRERESERGRQRKKQPATFNETLITYPFLERIRGSSSRRRRRRRLLLLRMASFDGFVWASIPFSIDRIKVRVSLFLDF